jgi:hypothetical protein
MGLSRRKRSPDRFIGGSKLNVPGQGIFSVKLIDNDKEPVGPQVKGQSHSRPKPETTTTTTTIPPTTTTTTTQTPEQLLNAIITEEPNVYIEPGFNEYLIYVDPPI